MADIDVKDICEAIAETMSDRHEFTDSTRQKAQGQLRKLVESRVHAGRQPQSSQGDHIEVLLQNETPDYWLGGQSDCLESLVEVNCYSTSHRRSSLIWHAVKQMLTSFTGTITLVSGTTMLIGGCTIENTSEFEPDDKSTEAKDEYTFIHQVIFRIHHEIVVPSGLA